MSRIYEKFVTSSFVESYKRYKNLQNRIDKKADQIMKNPYHNTEVLGKQEGDLRGLRSARIGRNFRIIFGVCEECRAKRFHEKNILFCKHCEDKEDESVVFLTVGTHKRAYQLK